MDGWNNNFLLGQPIFRGELLVLGSVTDGIDALDAFLLGSFEALFLADVWSLWTRYFVGNLPQSFSWCAKCIMNFA